MKTKQVAKKLQGMGTDGDTILAHINPEEAQVLKDGGGSGKRNPKTGLLSFGGYEGEGTGIGGAESGMGSGKPGESAMAQAAASQPAMAPDAYAGLQSAMLEAARNQDSGAFSALLGGIFGPLGGIAGKMGIGDKLSQAWNQRDIMGTPYGSTGGGFFSGMGGDYGNDRESGMGGGLGDMDRGAPITPPAMQSAPMFSPAPITQQPFVSKWGKPRTRGYFGG